MVEDTRQVIADFLQHEINHASKKTAINNPLIVTAEQSRNFNLHGIKVLNELLEKNMADYFSAQL